MVDSVFSFAEPGFQEFQTMEYLTAILAKNGFKITKGVAGIPTAWTATWGSRMQPRWLASSEQSATSSLIPAAMPS